MATALWVLTGIGAFLYHIAPPVLGVIVGGLLIQKYWVARANESLLIEYLIKEINDLVDEAVEYWTLNCTGEKDRQRARVLEPRIKGAIKNLTAALAQYSKRYCKHVDFMPLMGEVNDACTGGTFEGAKRGPDPARYMAVVNATHRVRWQLFERRV